MKLQNNLTAIIKAFKRPDAVVDLYYSIRKFYPQLRIIIVDDSENAMDTSMFDENVEYIHTDFDIGLSAGRNLAVKKVKTKYFLLLDDDFLFTKNTKLEKMHNLLETTDFQLVSGGVHDFGKEKRRFNGIFKKENDTLLLLEGQNNGKHQGYKKYDFVLNFFMAETKAVQQVLWDDEFKVGEHEDFFYRLSQSGVLMTDIAKQVFIEHYPQATLGYEEYRKRVFKYQAAAAKKHDVKQIKLILKPKLIVRVLLFITPGFALRFYRKHIKKLLGR